VNVLSVEAYLRTAYSPDREYRDGTLVERNVGERMHALLLGRLGTYVHTRRKQWDVEVYMSLRVRVRDGWYAVPDLCIYRQPAPTERFPSRPPLLWIEVLSEDDRMIQVWDKAREAVAFGTSYMWIIDPNTLDSQLLTPAGGPNEVPGKTLSIPDSRIVVPLLEVVEE
jgi:Uma2 family endonuclease